MVDLLDEVPLPSIFDGSGMVPSAMGATSIKSSPVDQLRSVSTSCKSVAQSKCSTDGTIIRFRQIFNCSK